MRPATADPIPGYTIGRQQKSKQWRRRASREKHSESIDVWKDGLEDLVIFCTVITSTLLLAIHLRLRLVQRSIALWRLLKELQHDKPNAITALRCSSRTSDELLQPCKPTSAAFCCPEKPGQFKRHPMSMAVHCGSDTACSPRNDATALRPARMPVQYARLIRSPVDDQSIFGNV